MSEEISLLYTGTVINATFIKNVLEDNGIPAIMRNDLRSGLLSGFGAASHENAVQLFVEDSQLEKALKILKEIESTNPDIGFYNDTE